MQSSQDLGFVNVLVVINIYRSKIRADASLFVVTILPIVEYNSLLLVGAA
jgi:hypothetical protein